MRIHLVPLTAALLLDIVGCTSASPGLEPATSQVAAEAASRLRLQGSLFPGDQAVLTNGQIEQILGSRVYPPEHGRIAVVRIGQRIPYWWWSEDVEALDQQTTEALLNKLRSSPRAADALMLPSLLVPQQTTVPYLREAAARVQADSLLVYRTYTQTYSVNRLFGPDETRAHCTVEALLLDTRSGIITTTAVATRNFRARQTGRDISFEETLGRAEQKAIAQALATVGDELLHFLNTAPVPGAPTTHPTSSAWSPPGRPIRETMRVTTMIIGADRCPECSG